MILKLDVKDCGQCPCLEAEESFWGDLCRAKCRVTGENVLFNIGIDRNEKCPLKPMPSQKNNQESVMVGSIDMDIGYILGWNACLDAIIGDTTDGI